MSSVKRYKSTVEGSGVLHVASENGRWVKWEDYEALLESIDRFADDADAAIESLRNASNQYPI